VNMPAKKRFTSIPLPTTGVKHRTASQRQPAGRGSRDLPEDMAELLRLCFDAAPDSMAVFLPDGRFAYVNKATCRNLGCSSRDLTGKTPWGFTPHMKEVQGRSFRQAIKRKKTLTFETVNCRKDGTTFPVEITATLIMHRGREYIFSYAKDISRRKQAEQALRESQDMAHCRCRGISHNASLHREDHSFR